MGIFDRMAQYREYRKGVVHCTFNPEGPGVVRIHVVPPKFSLFRSPSYIVILNGYYLLPLGHSWAILLIHFMEEVNKFDGRPIGEQDGEAIFERAVKRTHAVYPTVDRTAIREDLDDMLAILFAVARGDDPPVELEKLSIRAYGKHMTAPHRMDLMVSAMTDEAGCWKCNQRCTFCYAAGQTMAGVKELTTAEWKTVIDRLEAARVPMVTFTGGEPTLREDLPELVSYAKRMVTRVNTNGVNLTDALVNALKAAGLDSLQVTLYSHDEEIHNDLVGGQHFADTVAGLRRALTAGLDVSVNTPLCRKNRAYRETLVFLRDMGVRFVTASGLICTGMAGRNHAEYDLDREELAAVLKEAKDFCDASGMEIDFTSPGLLPKETLEAWGMQVPICGAALSNMAVAPDGTVVPCQSWLGTDAGLGNLLTDRFAKIWRHPHCVALRRMTEEEALSCPFRERKENAQ